jgi:hypothetical protein
LNQLLARYQPAPARLLTAAGYLAADDASPLPLLADAEAAFHAGPCILVAAADLPRAGALAAFPLPILPVSLDDHGHPVVCHPDGTSPLPALPPLALVALAFSAEGAALLRLLPAELGDPAGAPPLAELPPDSPIEAALALLGGAEALLRRHAGLLTSTLRSLAELRVVHDDHQRRLAELESVLSRANRQELELAFDEPPVAESGTLRLAAGETLRQLLPVASRGVAAVALHLADAPGPVGGSLLVALESLEDGVRHASWHLPLGGLGAGWQVLGLPRGIPGLRRSLRLSVSLAGEGEASLSLGDLQPLPMFRAEDVAGVPLAAASLAFRVLAGLPGLPPPRQALDHLAAEAEDGPGFEEVPLPADGAQSLLGPIPGRPMALVAEAEAESALLLDLPEGALALAALPGALPGGTVLVQAEALLEAGEAAEFALAAGHAPEEVLRLAEAGEGPAPGWSGWLPVAEALATLRLTCPAEPAPRDLMLLCRAAPGTGALRARLQALRATLAVAPRPAERALPPEPAAAGAPPPLAIPAEALRGRGLHELERAGGAAWRWLQPEAVIELDGLAPGYRQAVLDLPGLAPAIPGARLSATANGHAAEAVLEEGEAGATLRIALPRQARRGGRRLRLALSFGRAHTPPGEQRMLAAACAGLRLEG